MPRRALVLIDVQNDYFPGGKWPLVGIEAAADNGAKLLSSVQLGEDFVVHATIRPGHLQRRTCLDEPHNSYLYLCH